MGFKERIEVEDEGFQILRTFLEFPDLLVAAGFVVKDADYDVLVYGFSTAGCIL